MQGLMSPNRRGRIILKLLDVTKEEDVNRVLDEIVEEAGRIDLVICNAGMTYYQPAVEINTEDAKRLFEVNFWGAVYTAKAAARHMIPARKGKILMISSIVGEVSLPFSSIYSASKFAMRAFSDAARLELRPFDVDVVLVAPGAIASNIGVNNKDSLAHWDSGNSNYKPFAPLIEGIIEFDTNPEGRTPTKEFCEHVVAQVMPHGTVLRRQGPLEIFKGKLTTTIWILRMLPRGLSDWFLFRFSGIGAWRSGSFVTRY